MRHYSQLLRATGVARVISTQLLARIPAGMTSLGLLMHVEHLKGNYTAAGAVLAALSIGMAAAGPVVSRQLSRFGASAVLLTCLLLSTTALLPVVVAPLPLWAMVLLAALGGATIPPVQPTARTLYPRLAPKGLTQALFNLDAALQEIIWVLGPVLITTMAATVGTTVGMLVVLGIQLVGGLLFVLDPCVRALKIPASAGRFGSVLRKPSVIAMTAVSFLLIGALAAMEAGSVGTFGEGSLLSGWVLAISSIGSFLGGLAVGNRVLRDWSLTLRLAVLAVGLLLATVLSGFWGIAVALFIAGLGTAPAIAATSSVIAASVGFADSAEAYGWLTTGQLLGSAAGSALAGIAIDAYGGGGGMATGFAIATLGVAAAALLRGTTPRL